MILESLLLSRQCRVLISYNYIYICRYNIMLYYIVEMYVCIYTFDMYIYKIYVWSCHVMIPFLYSCSRQNCVTSTASAPRCLTGFTRSYRSSTCFAVDLVRGGCLCGWMTPFSGMYTDPKCMFHCIVVGLFLSDSWRKYLFMLTCLPVNF